MRSNKRDELTTNDIANAVLDRQQKRYLIDRWLLTKRAWRGFPVSRQALTSSNQSLGGRQLDEAKPMIVPKLVAVTEADWRMLSHNTRQPYSIHPHRA
jgi:hypothetical protein